MWCQGKSYIMNFEDTGTSLGTSPTAWNFWHTGFNNVCLDKAKMPGDFSWAKMASWVTGEW